MEHPLAVNAIERGGAAVLTTRDARLAAAAWVRDELEALPELVGAVLSGSARDRAPEDPHPATSDLDVWVIVDAPVPDPVLEPGGRFAFRKTHFRGVVVERAFFAWERLADPERLLGDVYVAPSLAPPAILADPSGRLARLGASVSAEFARPTHVRRRIEGALALASQLCDLSASGGAPPAFDLLAARALTLITAAAHAAAATAAAALLQPTARKAFVLSAQILERHRRVDLAEELLVVVGSAPLGRQEVERALAELEWTYDAAVAVRRTTFGLDHNVSREARDLALAGVRELVADHPREAMYQLAFLRCLVQNAIENDGSLPERQRSREGFWSLLSSLGLDTDEDRAARADAIRALLPRLRAGCEEVLARTPGVLDDDGE